MADHQRSKEAAAMLALHDALRNVCINYDWTYSVFWTIRPRPRCRGGGTNCKVGEESGSLMLMWEDGYCNLERTPSTSLCQQPSHAATSSTSTANRSPYASLMQPRGVTPMDHVSMQQQLLGQPEEDTEDPVWKSFRKMSIQLYNYGEGLMGKVASDKCHKWVFKESPECEAGISSYWQSSFDAHPPEWVDQFAAGIQTIAVIQAGQGLLQLGSCKVIAEDLHFVLRMRHAFESLEYPSGLYMPPQFSTGTGPSPINGAGFTGRTPSLMNGAGGAGLMSSLMYGPGPSGSGFPPPPSPHSWSLCTSETANRAAALLRSAGVNAQPVNGLNTSLLSDHNSVMQVNGGNGVNGLVTMQSPRLTLNSSLLLTKAGSGMASPTGALTPTSATSSPRKMSLQLTSNMNINGNSNVNGNNKDQLCFSPASGHLVNLTPHKRDHSNLSSPGGDYGSSQGQGQGINFDHGINQVASSLSSSKLYQRRFGQLHVMPKQQQTGGPTVGLPFLSTQSPSSAMPNLEALLSQRSPMAAHALSPVAAAGSAARNQTI